MPQDANLGPEVEEVRLAMAWNGGVSLAVWMGGVAVELDCARRARYGQERDGRSVYRALSLAFDRMLVVDIISGASAGGVNGALLAAAIQWGRRLDPKFLRDKWLNIGDFDKLLHSTTTSAPPSIMQGKLFLDALSEAFQDLKALDPATNARLEPEQPAAGPTRNVPEASADVLLDVQLTNTFGRQRRFVDEWNQQLVATEFRAPAKFRRRADYEPKALAVAARSSASFPVAFEPQKLTCGVLDLAGLPGVDRYAIDGGLLENAPIASAIALIPTRFAERPHRRFLCYVNAAPSLWAGDDDQDQEPPSLKDVVGYVVNLPRDGRFVDQLTAVEEAMRRAAASGGIQAALLELDREALRSTALALLPVYRRRRALASLDEAVTEKDGETDSGAARRAFKTIEPNPDLPWIPPEGRPLRTPKPWRWGVRPAQRIIHLQRDILGELYGEVPVPGQGPLHEHRKLCEEQLGVLDRLRASFDADTEIRRLVLELASGDPLPTLAELQRIYEEVFGGPIRQTVEVTLESLARLLGGLTGQRAAFYRTSLFGTDAALAGAGPVEVALDRLLSIEVVRRSQADDADVDISQPLSFAQLTPEAPGLIFSPAPFSSAGPSSGQDKLTGIRLGHFAGFYRRSWRVNDYMWGRLDAAARISDLLVQRGARRDMGVLVDVLAPTADAPAAKDLCWLVEEALEDAAKSQDVLPAVKTAAAKQGSDLAQRLADALTADVDEQDARAGLFTRVVCARAAQYQVLQQELPCLDAETTDDRRLGCFTAPLDLSVEGSLRPAIKDLRKGWQEGGQPLPARIGRDVPEEGASSLALQTITHALLVALAAVGGIAPLGKILGAARLPALSVAGVAARGLVQRAAVLLGFGGAAFYVTARLVASNGKTAKFGSLWDPDVLLSWLCLLGIVGVVFVPAWRGWKTTSNGRRAVEWLFASAVAVTGAALAIGLTVWKLGPAVTATTAAETKPFHAPHAVVVTVLAVALAGPLAVRRVAPSWLPEGIDKRTPPSVVIGLAALALFIVSVSTVYDGLTDTETWWHMVAAACAIVSVLVCAAYVVWKSDPREATRRLRAGARRLRGAARRRSAPS